MTILLNSSIFAVQNLGSDGAFQPHLATRLATVTDGYVVLILPSVTDCYLAIANP